jgi:hypothetical protein
VFGVLGCMCLWILVPRFLPALFLSWFSVSVSFLCSVLLIALNGWMLHGVMANGRGLQAGLTRAEWANHNHVRAPLRCYGELV